MNRLRTRLMAAALPLFVGILQACSTVSATSSVVDAKRSLAAASWAIENRNFAGANVLLRDALRTLGDSYHSPSMVDDTGMSLVLADAEERKGREDVAANLRRNVLDSRLAMLEQRRLGP